MGCDESSMEGTTPKAVSLGLAAVLAAALGVRLIGADQPLVENYVGRQVPTAMVARNLERGSGFLRPSLDVAPRPNLFLVEPPLYEAAVVGWRRVTGWPLGASGRAVSAFGVALGVWGLFGLARRREGPCVALTAAAVFASLPVTLRYGRAFQPDALMLGCLVAGMRCWDGSSSRRRRGRTAGLLLVAAGLALKVVSAYVLAPLALLAPVGRRRGRWGAVAGLALTLVPAGLWYAYAAGVLAHGGGSRASADNSAVWLAVLVPRAWLKAATYRHIGRFLLVRAFTPLGPPLAVAGLFWARPRADRLWVVWGASALAALTALAAKLHHEYYWLALAPVVSVGVARALAGLAARGAWGRAGAVVAGSALLGLSAACAVSTWRTPAEWRGLRAAAAELQDRTLPGEVVMAPEALIFETDRPGCRLEFTPAAARRAAGEWGEPLGGSGPLALVELYRARGAAVFADVVPPDGVITPDRLALHAAVRRRYVVEVDRPGVLIARLRPRTEPDPGARPSWPPTPPTTARSPSPTSPGGRRRGGRSAS